MLRCRFAKDLCRPFKCKCSLCVAATVVQDAKLNPPPPPPHSKQTNKKQVRSCCALTHPRYFFAGALLYTRKKENDSSLARGSCRSGTATKSLLRVVYWRYMLVGGRKWLVVALRNGTPRFKKKKKTRFTAFLVTRLPPHMHIPFIAPTHFYCTDKGNDNCYRRQCLPQVHCRCLFGFSRRCIIVLYRHVLVCFGMTRVIPARR